MDGEIVDTDLNNNNRVSLPDCVYLNEYGGNYQEYMDAVYSIFRRDFVVRKPFFRGRRLGLKAFPIEGGREYTFYHMTHEGHDERNRTPCLRRCERIAWLKPLIEHCDEWNIKVWPQERNGKKRICIWLELEDEPDHIIILDDRGDYLLPWTAYPIEWKNQKAKKQKEYEEYLESISKQQGPPI